MLRPILTLCLLILPLAACSFGAPPPPAQQQADLEVCTQQANAYERAHDSSWISRNEQFATPFQGTPDPQYINNRLAAIHARRGMINNCMRNSNPDYVDNGASMPEPKIIGPAS